MSNGNQSGKMRVQLLAWGFFAFSVGVMFSLWHIEGYVNVIYPFGFPLGVGATIQFIGLLIVLVGLLLQDEKE
jgi:hypothetical protein